MELPQNLTKANVSSKIFGTTAKNTIKKGIPKRFMGFAKHLDKINLKNAMFGIGIATTLFGAVQFIDSLDSPEAEKLVAQLKMSAEYYQRIGYLKRKHYVNYGFALTNYMEKAGVSAAIQKETLQSVLLASTEAPD